MFPPRFGERVVGADAVDDAVERIFNPEFRNRLDRVVGFDRLDEEVMLQIVDKELRLFTAQLLEKGVELQVSAACRRALAHEGHSPEFGARNVSRLIQVKVKNFFVDSVLFGDLVKGGKALVDLDAASGEVVIRTGKDLPAPGTPAGGAAKKRSPRGPRKK